MKLTLRRILWGGLIVLLAAGWQPVHAAGSSWLQFNYDAQHSGTNPAESTLTAANAPFLTQLFQATLPDVADGAPVYLASLDLLYVTTRDGHILALNGHDGTTVWSRQYGPGSCRINNINVPCYTTSSPVIDPNLAYVYSYGLDGSVHKYQAADGVEITGGGWPELATLKGYDEKSSPALTFATSGGVTYLYVANGGYPGDAGDYQGHITAINLSTGAQKVFNAMCSDQAIHFSHPSPDCSGVDSAIWARAGVVYDASLDRIFMSTGNGVYNPGPHYWGDTVFKLSPDGSGANGNPLDAYTPGNFAALQAADADLGSTNVAILPAPAGSSVQQLGVQSGKDGMLRLLNLANLSGQGGPGHTGGEVGSISGVPQGGEVLTAPAVWTNPANHETWVFVANDNGISGLRLGLSGSTPVLSGVWTKSPGGTSPVVANGVLVYASSGTIHALDPSSGNPLWSKPIGSIHWESPIVVNGLVYITDGNKHLTAFFPVDLSTLTHKEYLAVILK